MKMIKKRRLSTSPWPLLVLGLVLILVLILFMVLVYPYAMKELHEFFDYSLRYSEGLVVFIFFAAAILIVLLISFIAAFWARTRRRAENQTRIHISGSNYGEYDDDRSFVEKKIKELSNQLISSEARWEKLNELVLSSHNRNLTNSGVVSSNAFLSGFGVDVDAEIDKKLVFILTPYHEDYFQDYLLVKDICNEMALRASRGDEERVVGDLFKHIIQQIAIARIVIANVNGRNANVFYELGIAHMMNKPTILISRVDNDIPFDVQGRFIVLYRDEEDLIAKLRKQLAHILVD